ncbi:MAG: DUF2188 domain-containing protein [Bryobacterales bacterium]|nr:DUF2188 domain-containing protein [Bryobacterales bacterium]
MASKTVHVFASGGEWAMKGEGGRPKSYRTQREAISAGLTLLRTKPAGQLVIHGRNGQIRQHQTYKMTPIQEPPKKSRSSRRISSAVGRLALERINADGQTPCAHAPEK